MVDKGILHMEDPDLRIHFQDIEHIGPTLSEAKDILQGKLGGKRYKAAIDQKQLHGEYVLYDKEDKIIQKSYYKKGVLHGPSMSYFSDGTLAVLSWYIHGRRQGKVYKYYQSGSLESLLQYKDGVLEGTQKIYHPNGLLKTHYIIDQGEVSGKVEEYFSHGEVKRSYTVEKSLRNGEDTLFDETGKSIFSITYNQGKEIAASIPDPLSTIDKQAEIKGVTTSSIDFL